MPANQDRPRATSTYIESGSLPTAAVIQHLTFTRAPGGGGATGVPVIVCAYLAHLTTLVRRCHFLRARRAAQPDRDRPRGREFAATTLTGRTSSLRTASGEAARCTSRPSLIAVHSAVAGRLPFATRRRQRGRMAAGRSIESPTRPCSADRIGATFTFSIDGTGTTICGPVPWLGRLRSDAAEQVENVTATWISG